MQSSKQRPQNQAPIVVKKKHERDSEGAHQQECLTLCRNGTMRDTRLEAVSDSQLKAERKFQPPK